MRVWNFSCGGRISFSICGKRESESEWGEGVLSSGREREPDYQNINEDAVSQIDRIAVVVEKNVNIYQNTKQASANMSDITGRLMEIVD